MAATDMTSPTESMEMAGNENSGFEDHDDGACTTKMVDMGAFTIYVNDEDDNNTLPQRKQQQQQQQKTEVTSSISNSTSCGIEMRNPVSGEEADDHESKSKSSDGGRKEERSGCGVGDNMGGTTSNNVTDNQNEQQKEGGAVVVEVKEEGEGQGDVQEKTAITRVVLPYRSMRDINRILTKRMTGSVDVSINRINQTLACSTR